jgi:ABC-type dipeptide/oligopeptide/nickel transport system ATPase component
MPKKDDKEQSINWYEKIPKRFLTKSHNPHYDKHKIKIPFRLLITGSSGSGKTNTLLSLINIMPNTWEKIVIITKNKNEPLYEWLEDKLGKEDFKIQEIDKEGMPDLDKFDKTKNNLVVMDDLVGEKNQKPMEQFFLRSRKVGCSLVYITQSYYQVPKMIRNNLNYIIIKQIASMKNLIMISREYDLGLDKKDLIQIYEDATNEKMGFLLIDLEANPKEKFRKNFDEIYEIE